jgi:hypothetical protein
LCDEHFAGEANTAIALTHPAGHRSLRPLREKY